MSANVHAPSTHFSPTARARHGALWSFLSYLKRTLLHDPQARRAPRYISTDWEMPATPADDIRLAACARLLRNHTCRANVLEIGCGEAHLMRYLRSSDYASWLGVDVSEDAVNRAREFGNERVRYVAANASALEPDNAYDAIIFSQSIYYLPDPAALFQRYARFLKPSGVFILSLFENGTQAPVWREIKSIAYTVGSCVIQNERGIWTCEALRMRRTDWHTALDHGSF